MVIRKAVRSSSDISNFCKATWCSPLKQRVSWRDVYQMQLSVKKCQASLKTLKLDYNYDGRKYSDAKLEMSEL